MLEAIGHFIIAYLFEVLAFAAIVIVAIVYYLNKTMLDFWWMNAWYGVPLIGTLAQLSRRVAPADNEYRGWLQSEQKLGTDYAHHIDFLSPRAFEANKVYIARAGDKGRRPLPVWYLLILIILLAAEGYGFSYLLAGSLAADMSENARQIGTIAIVAVVCIVLMVVTHAAGYHIFRNLTIRECEKRWDVARSRSDRSDDKPVQFQTMRDIGIEEGSSRDDSDHPEYSQCVNRVGVTKNWTVPVLAAIFILAIGTGQIVMRVQAIDQALTCETVQGLADGDIPAELRAPQQAAQSRACTEQNGLSKDIGLTNSIMLALIFLITQMTAVYAGYKYGFAGKESADAHDVMRGCVAYDVYMRRVNRWIGIAERRMQALHQRIRDNPGNGDVRFGGGFRQFLELLNRLRSRPPEDLVRPAAPAAKPAQATQLDALRAMTREERRAHVRALSASEMEAIKPYLIQIKAEEEADEKNRQDAWSDIEKFI